MGYNTQFLASVTIYTARDPWYTVIWKSTKLVNVISGRLWATAHGFLAPGTISTARDPRYTVIWKSTKLVNFVFSGRFHEL